MVTLTDCLGALESGEESLPGRRGRGREGYRNGRGDWGVGNIMSIIGTW